jgi:hypothetical protein
MPAFSATMCIASLAPIISNFTPNKIMKKYTYLFLLALAISFCRCGKPLDDVNDYFPEVKVVSYTPEVDGSVTITAEVTDNGASDLEYVGMCFSESATPNAEDDQKLAELSNGRFSVNYSYYTDENGSTIDLNSDETYKVRAFATNDFGYSWSKVFVIGPWTVPSVEAPCEPANNTINYGSGTFAAFTSGPSTVNSTYDYTMNSSQADVKFSFGGPLETGVFTTASSSSFLTSHQVYIQLTMFNIYSVLAGSQVYVNEISDNQFEVTICNAPTNIGSGSNFTARFIDNG